MELHHRPPPRPRAVPHPVIRRRRRTPHPRTGVHPLVARSNSEDRNHLHPAPRRRPSVDGRRGVPVGPRRRLGMGYGRPTAGRVEGRILYPFCLGRGRDVLRGLLLAVCEAVARVG